MADQGLKPVGVQLVAQDGAEFVATVEAASKAETGLTQTTVALNNEVPAGVRAWQAMNEAWAQNAEQGQRTTATLKELTTADSNMTFANQQAAAALRDVAAAQKEEADAATTTTTAHTSNFTVMREGRLVMGALIADMALMQLTAGQTNPQIKEMGQSLQTVIDTGMLAFIATGDPVIAVAAGIAAGLLAVTQMATQADPAIVALNKDLEKFAAKDDAVQGLMKLTGATKDDAQAALDFAKAHPEAAAELKGFSDQAQSSTPILQGVADALALIAQALGDVVRGIAPATDGIGAYLKATQIVADAGMQFWKVLHDTGDLQQANAAYAQFLADGLTQQEVATRNLTAATQDLAQAERLEIQAKADAKESDRQRADLISTVADDARKVAQLQIDDQAKLTRAARDANDQIAQDARALRDSLAQISFQRTQTEENNAQQVLQINQAMDDAIEKAGQALADKEASIQQQTNDRLAALYHDYQGKVETADDALLKAHQTYADKLAQIDKAEITDLANLDFTTKEQLDAAKTQNDKEQVLERAAHEREVIRSRAADQKSAAEQSLEDSEKVANKQKTDALAVYEYQRGLEQQHAAQQVADAERAYARQVADAKNRDAEQLASLAFRIQQEEEALNRQVENARTRYAQQVADLRTRLIEEVQDTIAAEVAKVQAIVAEIQARMMNLALITQTANAEASQAAALSGVAGAHAGVFVGPNNGGGGGGSSGFGAAEGMDAIVSSPMTIQVAEGYRPERVHVQPLSSNTSTTNNRGPINVTINSNNPDAVWEIFQKKLAQEVWR